jgi:hypothetical protein
MGARRNGRRNASGEWRCCGCRVALPAEAYLTDKRSGRPESYCRPCRAKVSKAARGRKGLDEGWWARERARLAAGPDRAKGERRRVRREERAALARVLLGNLRARGVSGKAVQAIAGISERTQRSIVQGAELYRRDVLERLVLLHQVSREVPPWPGPMNRAHPHLAVIAYRYEALRAAHG